MVVGIVQLVATHYGVHPDSDTAHPNAAGSPVLLAEASLCRALLARTYTVPLVSIVHTSSPSHSSKKGLAAGVPLYVKACFVLGAVCCVCEPLGSGVHEAAGMFVNNVSIVHGQAAREAADTWCNPTLCSSYPTYATTNLSCTTGPPVTHDHNHGWATRRTVATRGSCQRPRLGAGCVSKPSPTCDDVIPNAASHSVTSRLCLTALPSELQRRRAVPSKLPPGSEPPFRRLPSPERPQLSCTSPAPSLPSLALRRKCSGRRMCSRPPSPNTSGLGGEMRSLATTSACGTST